MQQEFSVSKFTPNGPNPTLSPSKQGKDWENSQECEAVIASFMASTTIVQQVAKRQIKGAADFEAVALSGRKLPIEVKWSTWPGSWSLKDKDFVNHAKANRGLLLACYNKQSTNIIAVWFPPGSIIEDHVEVTPKEGGYYLLRLSVSKMV